MQAPTRKQTIPINANIAICKLYIRSIIIINKMKKLKNQEIAENPQSKTHRLIKESIIIQDRELLAQIYKNGQFTGNCLENIQRQYYPQSKRSSDASCSIVLQKNQKKNQMEQDQTKASKDKSNNSSTFSTKAELENQIQRLNTQLQIREQRLKDFDKNHENKKGEIIQLNKIINFHKGRIDQMEAQLRSYEDSMRVIAHQCDEKSKYKSQVQELVNLFEGMRKQNQILNGKYEQKNYQLNKLTEKYIRLKQKLSKTTSILNKGQHIRSSSIKSDKSNSLTRRVYEPLINQKVKKNYIWTLQTKIQSIQNNLKEIMKQNDILQTQLEQKQRLISEMIEQKQMKEQKTQDQNIIVHYNCQKKDYVTQQDSNKVSRNLLLENQLKTQSTLTNKPKSAINISLIIRKLRYHLMSEELTYQNLLNILISKQYDKLMFVRQPYGLSQQEAEQFISWLKKVFKKSVPVGQQQSREKILKYLRQKIAYFRNLSLRRQHNIKLNIFKQYLNREREMVQKIKQQSIMLYQSAEEYFLDWGLSKQQVDIILKCYYEETGQIQWVNFEYLKNVIGRWQNI